jgi:hypothetical protein
LQRKARSGGPFEAPSIVDDVLRSPGQPLDHESRGFMEKRFGYDFSAVRVHADEQAQRSADATNAEAYTVGRDIVFASGRYAPHTPAGQELLAHELTHVVQQRSAPSSGPIEMGEKDEYETSADQTAAEIVSSSGPVPAVRSTGVTLQRQEAADKATPDRSTANAPCLEEVEGEEIKSLLQAGVLTIIEFGAEWCIPCQQLKADLDHICKRFSEQPPPVTVRFYSIDIEKPGNEEESKPYVAGGGVPYLYFFVGSTEKEHYNSAPQPDVLDKIVADNVSYAATSGAARGAYKGMGWGSLVGGLLGIGGAVAIGTQTNLEGNAMVGAIMGTIAGGAAVGLGIGAAIGAIAGHVGDDRHKGPKEQKRRKLQKQSRDSQTSDEQRRRRDLQTQTQAQTQTQTQTRQRSEDASLPMSRAEKTAAGAGIGAAAGAGAGALLGLGIAHFMDRQPYGEGAGWGALIGGIAGLLGGFFYGLFARNTDRESTAQADALIRRRYGRYLRDGSAGPLHNARVNVVPRSEICERKACRTSTPVDPECGLLGWADSGPPIRPSLGPGGAQPAPTPNAAAEPTCGGRQMDHATTDRPVIYYANDAPGGTMIHEGLHAWSHPDFSFLHNHVNEGTTEYFTRRLQDDINMPHYGSYEDEYNNVKKLADLVGEERLARGYFTGQMAELHHAVNSQLGECALITWSFALQQGSIGWADEILENRHQNYCESRRFRDVRPGDLTPPPPAQQQTQQQQQTTEQR